MHILCTICSDLVNPAESIYVTKCGHIFHQHCLTQWLERSKSCPQCRNRVTEKCMFRLYPTVSNESNGEDAATLQSRLDNAQLELRQERAKYKEKDERITSLADELKKQEEIITKYEKQLVSYDSKVKAIREQLTYANLQSLVASKLRDENDNLKKNIQTLNGLQRVLNGTTDEVEEMLKGYTELRTIATFATALKRALCESELKKKEWRDRLFTAQRQQALWKKTEADLQNKVKSLESELQDSAMMIESLKEELNAAALKKHSREPREPCEPWEEDNTPQKKTNVVVHVTPKLNDAILETDSNNISFNTMVDNIEKSDSPYLDLKQGGLLCMTALQRAPAHISDRTRFACKPASRLNIKTIKNNHEKRVEPQMATSIFHRKEPMKIASFDAKSLDISYDGMGGHSKLETFPIPKKSPLKSCIPKVSAKHKLKRPNSTGNYDIETMLKKIREK